MQPAPILILASASPRRHQLLQTLGWNVEVQPVHANEERLPAEGAIPMVQRLAALKAFARYHDLPPVAQGQAPCPRLIVGADTTVEVDGRLLGKPADRQEALAFLELLQARDHYVHSGLCLVDAATGQACVRVHSSRVGVRHCDRAEMEAYVDSGASMDKAGGYALQDRDFHPVAALEGCAASVMGLPLALLVTVCQEQFGCPPPPGLCPGRCAHLTGHTCCRQSS